MPSFICILFENVDVHKVSDETINEVILVEKVNEYTFINIYACSYVFIFHIQQCSNNRSALDIRSIAWRGTEPLLTKFAGFADS